MMHSMLCVSEFWFIFSGGGSWGPDPPPVSTCGICGIVQIQWLCRGSGGPAARQTPWIFGPP